MNVENATLQIPYREANEAFRAYRTVVKDKTATRDDVMLYRALRRLLRGAQVIDINRAIHRARRVGPDAARASRAAKQALREALMRKSRKQRKPKRVSYELLLPEMPEYKRLRKLVRAHHDDISGARIGLAWCTSWKPDVDGVQKLGQCKKASDLDRELADFDFVILLLKSFWQDDQVSELQRDALLDHELCHAAVAHDKDGEPLVDERDRVVYRLRRHDLEEFAEIASRYGTWKRDLEQFAKALQKAKQPQAPLPMDDHATAH